MAKDRGVAAALAATSGWEKEIGMYKADPIGCIGRFTAYVANHPSAVGDLILGTHYMTSERDPVRARHHLVRSYEAMPHSMTSYQLGYLAEIRLRETEPSLLRPLSTPPTHAGQATGTGVGTATLEDEDKKNPTALVPLEEEMVKWYWDSAQKGEFKARNQLGCYFMDRGDFSLPIPGCGQTVEHLLMAAKEAGIPQAFNNLVRLYSLRKDYSHKIAVMLERAKRFPSRTMYVTEAMLEMLNNSDYGRYVRWFRDLPPVMKMQATISSAKPFLQAGYTEGPAECTVCLKDHPECIRVVCGHQFCDPCLVAMYSTSLLAPDKSAPEHPAPCCPVCRATLSSRPSSDLLSP